jgi:pilus assembly protein CpaE
MAKLQTLVVDSSPSALATVLTVLEFTVRCEVVGEASNGEEALEMARSLSPELVLMDWHLPAMNGLDTLRALRSEMPETAVVLMSMSPEPGDRDEAISLGAHAFLDKGNRFHRELLRVVAGLSPI